MRLMLGPVGGNSDTGSGCTVVGCTAAVLGKSNGEPCPGANVNRTNLSVSAMNEYSFRRCANQRRGSGRRLSHRQQWRGQREQIHNPQGRDAWRLGGPGCAHARTRGVIRQPRTHTRPHARRLTAAWVGRGKGPCRGHSLSASPPTVSQTRVHSGRTVRVKRLNSYGYESFPASSRRRGAHTTRR